MADPRPELQWIAEQQGASRAALLHLAQINSGSFNADGVAAVADALEPHFAPLAGPGERIELAAYTSTADDGSLRERRIGPAVRWRQRPDAPLQVLLCGHMDTVYGIDSPFQRVRALDEDRLNGPGVADLKGGLLVMSLALAALERSPHRDRIGWTVLLNPDEEIGSRGSALLLARAATQHHLGLIYEPAYADGNLASSRKGSGNFDLIVHGRAAHAGRNPGDGRNAVVAASELIARLYALNGQRDGLTVNPAYVHGGGALNIVPERCVFKFNVRTTQPDDEAWLMQQLATMQQDIDGRDGYTLEIRGGFTRPPKVFDDAHQRLAAMIDDCGRQLGLDLQFKPTGGCCDGNNLAACGLPNIDNLGVVGGEIHSDREWMRVSSLVERAQLSALLLLRLADGELTWSA
jgi:glutamate carboxypeptidase